MEKKVNIITEYDGKQIVMISDVRFKGKTKEEWAEVEEYLKEYIGTCYEIVETAEKIYIGKDFPDEFTHGKDKTILGLPVYNLQGEIERYNIFKLRMLVRHDADGKLYLYDFLRTKKEMSSPL